MSPSTSPSPPPRSIHAHQSPFHPQDSSTLSNPLFESTLPLPRPLSASSVFRRSSLAKNRRLSTSQHRRRTRSGTSFGSHSSNGSLGDFSMENYTIDIAQLGRKEVAARPVGYEQVFGNRDLSEEKPLEGRPNVQADDREHGQDFMDGYEVDLGGFGDKPSSLLVEDIIHHREEVPSDDEGPEDFTQNLEAWMRGSRRWKKEQDDDIAEGHEPDPDPEQNLREVMEKNGHVDESTFEPLGTSTPAPFRSHAIIDEGFEQEALTPAPPSLSRLNTEMLQDKATEEVFDRISALQAEVEQLRREDETRRADYQALEREYGQAKKEYEVSKEDQQDQYAELNEQYEQCKQDYASAKDSLEEENGVLTHQYNDVLERLRVLEKTISTEQGVKDEPSKVKDRVNALELETVRAAAKTDQATAQSNIKALQELLEASKDESRRLQAQVESIQQSHENEIHGMQADLDARRNEVALERKESVDRANEAASLTDTITFKDKENQALQDEVKAIKMEVQHALDQLTETRRILDSVEDENDRLVQQNERNAQDISELKAAIVRKEVQETTVAPPTDQQSPSIDKATHTAALEDLVKEHQAKTSTLISDHAQETQTLRDALLKARESAQERELEQKEIHRAEITALEHQIVSLKGRLLKPPPPSQNSVETELRSAVRTLSTKLKRADAATATARAQAEQTRRESDNASQTNAVVNAELEARFAETIETREGEWTRRIELLFKERDKMSKALMWGWGREEVGPKASVEREQGYRYRFSRRV